MLHHVRNLWGRWVLMSLSLWVGGSLYAATGDGLFDLNLWDRSRQLNLDGQWLYMPGRFVEPQDFEDILDHDNQDIKVLKAGASIQDEAHASRFGTYILRLSHPQKLEEMAIFHGLYYSSAKSQVFCRNLPQRSLTLNLGQVGASANSSTPKLSTFAVQNLQELSSVMPCSELVIMLQVSSFHHSWAGMWLPPRLGLRAEFQDFIQQQDRSYAFILGILLFVSFYAGSFALRRRQERSALYVSLGAMLLGLRIACLFRAAQSAEGSSPWVWQIENLFIYGAGYLVPYLSLKSLKYFLPGTHLSQKAERLLDGLAVTIIMIQLLTPVRFWTEYAGAFLLFGVACVLIVFHYLIQALRRHTPKVWPHVLGVIFAFSGMVLEMLVVYRVIDYLPLNISGYGSAIWISLQLQLSAQRFADALEKSEYLSRHLQDEVQKQTEKLRELNRYIAENVLRRFLPPTVVADIVAGKRTLDEKARTLEITVLFADLCNFTRLSAQEGPERTAHVLNGFLVQMTETVFAYNGTIDKFLGDGVLVLFGAPEVMDLHAQAEAAWRCATEMQEALQRLNKTWQAEGWPAVEMRIGIHCGSAFVGSFGGPMRSDYTAIGDTVNLASRIQSVAEPNQILMSEEMARHLPQRAKTRNGSYQLKGIRDAQVLYQLRPWTENTAISQKKSS
ncbi:MAG TPA: adenylate/guanylate cyclase domain-containing protein [Oligoflexus sp.]|uniref:adenylate/guanylate cyclase domain-containing protein n=1 Tax=Oligoflexus sp. TaxID=1971216 RepID=UPI002D810865|nr:adenylate/guanylate cyclase domain-containing protein [Oligoflexus sp.]HET9238615.1 adenylate/guanylate cyclase domain-containing protein [Oligoflexus sp.]